MRKILAMFAVLAVIALSACNGKSNVSDSNSTTVNESSTVVSESSAADNESSTTVNDSAPINPLHRDDDYTSTVSDFTVEFDDGEAEIVRYNGTGGDVVIPAEINGMRVAEIESRAFENCVGLTGITIPGSVESIGEDAFANCVNLSSVTIENGVREIDEYAFSGCTALTRLDIPESVVEIERFAFSGCLNLTVTYHGRTYAGEDIFRIYNES
ncbi:MAG: leucine-rich repeat domain-containing protein [Ruminococcaceae bacterium]|nr:leucine-rich repeat domain-containing protein [Oscillospiraceae bacterium]